MGKLGRVDLFRVVFLLVMLSSILALSYLLSSLAYVYYIHNIPLPKEQTAKKIDFTVSKQLNFITHIFAKKATLEQNIQKSPLAKPINFTLLGTLLTDNFKSAILKMETGIKVIKQYQKITEGVILSQVRDFYIIVDVNGVNKVVELNKDFKHEPTSSENLPPLSSVVPIPQGAQNFVIDKRLVDELTKDVGQFLKDVRIIPYFENGVTAGFKFDFVRQGSLLEQNGIRQGDKIISINGNPVKTTEDSFKLYNMLRTEKFISIVLEDQNGKRTVNYEIR
ncbi:MAG: hypothetical protein N3C60_03180 [Calditerrivibrio sp.]|nr:hypothetical protein [Calditerrivibrio sp.]